MPITITLPPPGTRVGPGMQIGLSSDFIGPLPSGTVFTLRIGADSEGGNPVINQRIDTLGPTTSDFIASRYDNFLTSDQGALAAGDTAHVVVELVTPTGTVDSGSTTATWDPTTMLWQHVSENTPATAGGGLTTTQAQQLADDHAAINPPLLAHDGTPITGAVGDTIVRPALKFLGIDTTAYELTGSGTLDVPNIAGVQTAWGIVLDVLEYPPGTSYMPGYVRSFHPRAAQFLLLWPAKNTAEAMVIDELRLHLEHRTWAWDWANVIAVAYYITPGWTVQLRFVSAFFP